MIRVYSMKYAVSIVKLFVLIPNKSEVRRKERLRRFQGRNKYSKYRIFISQLPESTFSKRDIRILLSSNVVFL